MYIVLQARDWLESAERAVSNWLVSLTSIAETTSDAASFERREQFFLVILWFGVLPFAYSLVLAGAAATKVARGEGKVLLCTLRQVIGPRI